MVKFILTFLIGLCIGILLTLAVQTLFNREKKHENIFDTGGIDSLSTNAKREYLEDRARARKKESMDKSH